MFDSLTPKDQLPGWKSALTRLWTALKAHKLVAALCTLVVLGATGTGIWWSQRSDLPGDAAFRVYGNVVTQDDLQALSSSYRALYGVQVPTDSTKLAQFWRDLAKSDAVSAVLVHAADTMGVTVNSADGQQALTSFVTRVYGSGTAGQNAYVAALANAGTSQTAMLQEVTRQLLVARLYAKVTAAAANPSDAQLQSGYANWSCRLGTPAARNIENIVVLDQATATTIAGALRNGADWHATVQKYSADQSTIAHDGSLGTLTADQLEPAYAKAAFAAQQDAIFGPVQTAQGWNIGRVVGIQAAKPTTFASAKSEVAQLLIAQEKAGIWSSWLHAQLVSADVDYASQYRPADPTAAPTNSALDTAIPASCKG